MKAQSHTEYREYLLKDNHIYKPPYEFVAPDDAAALEVGQHLVDGHDVEVWERKRQVRVLKRKPPACRSEGSS